MKLFLIVVSAFLAVAAASTIPDDTINNRIVGGQDATLGQFPYMVSLRRQGQGHFCGAAVITSRYAATAAHCIDNVNDNNVNQLTAAVGTISVNSGPTFPIVQWFLHERYNARHFLDLDVGAVQIGGNFYSVPGVTPISLGTVTPPTGTEVTVSGWGWLQNGGPSLPQTLQWTTVNVVEHSVCASRYPGMIGVNQMCASYPGRDACQMDSGGPLTANGNLVGIVSWGGPCADAHLPGVYVDVAAPEVQEYLTAFIEADPIQPF